MKRLTRNVGASIALTLATTVPLAGVAEATNASQSYPNVSTSYTQDGQWRASLDANTYNFFIYKQIGATVSTQHREWACGWVPFCLGGHSWQWVSRPAAYIQVTNIYTPYPPQYGNCDPMSPAMCAPPAPPRYCSAANSSGLSCYDFSIFFTWPASPAPLNIKGVRSSARVDLSNGQSLGVGPVDDAFGGF